jgi:predicted helicase
MLAYGLFLARLNSDLQPITLHNAREYVPGSFRLIRELVDFLAELQKDEYRDVRWVIEEVLSIINGLDLAAIHEDLSFRQRKAISRKVRASDEEEHRLFERDPFTYFYEDYLRAYDPAMRKGRGVYYTPPPAVNFIVRGVDEILKASFGIPDGLADHQRVTVLDFACGTGTFLLEVFQRIFDNIGGSDAGRAGPIVHEHFLRHIFGFEYLIAPYTVAHLKLSQYLRDQKHPLKNNERLQVFLTNTLEPVEPQTNLLLPAVSAEVKAAQTVKDRGILVIVGNPPYAYESKNNGAAIMAAIGGYKYTVERRSDPKTPGQMGPEQRVPLRERNPRALNDDYVKFIRFAQLKMDAVEEGVVGIITNHAWLDNPTFRGMRQSLMRSFEQIYVLDLHGNANKKERTPDGGEDKNVFDIKQGVAISLFVKRRDLTRGVWHADVWGTRLRKYRKLADASRDSINWITISPRPPWYLFRPFPDEDTAYGTFQAIPDIFVRTSVGVVTGRDEIALRFSPEEMLRTVQILAQGERAIASSGLNTGKDSTEWILSDVVADIQGVAISSDKVKPLTYRPFDTRFAFRTGSSRGLINRPRIDVWQDFDDPNLGLATSRLTKGENFAHAFITDQMIEKILLSSKTSNNAFVFPVYTHDDKRRVENISGDFRAFLDARYEHHYTPEEILGYLYAVLHSSIYRLRYAELLRVDFPRVPFPESANDFEALSGFGWALVQAHLLRGVPRRGLAVYHGKGEHIVEAVRYSPADQALAINNTQSFRPVPRAVWNFHIGGYRVLDKYLKSRKGRALSLDEINHVGAIADSLAFTIEQMAKIDEAYRGAFPDRG